MPLPAAVPIETGAFAATYSKSFLRGAVSKCGGRHHASQLTVRPDALCLAASTVQAAAGQVQYLGLRGSHRKAGAWVSLLFVVLRIAGSSIASAITKYSSARAFSLSAIS